LLENIKNLPLFHEILEKSKEIEEEVALPGVRISYLLINGQKLQIHHGREKLKKNPRFELVQLFNPQPYRENPPI
jgi:hypothetical protein